MENLVLIRPSHLAVHSPRSQHNRSTSPDLFNLDLREDNLNHYNVMKITSEVDSHQAKSLIGDTLVDQSKKSSSYILFAKLV